MIPMDKAQTGRLGEDFCEKYYIKRGFSTVQRNYHSRFGEIDLICENSDFLAFVEVKTRKADSITQPCEAVDLRKQKRIVRTAQMFLLENETDKQPRFDVFEVFVNEGRVFKFNLIENAFDESCFGGYDELF